MDDLSILDALLLGLAFLLVLRLAAPRIDASIEELFESLW